MTYAIIETGGKQYKAKEGDLLDVEKLEGQTGKTVKLDKILLLTVNGSLAIGRPYVKGAVVEAEVVNNHRSGKTLSFKYIRREGGAKTKIGHRQSLTRIKILSIKKGS